MKIGLLGGTFDPVHRGHTYTAQRIINVFALDRVVFLVSNLPPHKHKGTISSPYHRYAMAALEVQRKKRLFTSVWELERPRVSYTYETLEHYRSCNPADSICFIAGSDSLSELHLWKEYARLLEKYTFVFVQRPGAEVDISELKIAPYLRKRISTIRRSERPSIRPGVSFLIHVQAPPFSSTHIRESIAKGAGPPPGALSLPVWEYIQKNHLYEQSAENTSKNLQRY
ncbi:MAG: nicotinate (nicotinamide) nucleotide adenylyltransferase [Acidobacteria bacterium]|nr:nicotinate (nicotinamide) nucleotide adenylyltransferase [Acidobacteriota bacterium]